MIVRTLPPVLMMPFCAWAQLQLLLLDAGSELPVKRIIDLGVIAAGDVLDATFRIKNTGLVPGYVHLLSVAGAGFSLRVSSELPLVIPAGGTVDFQVRFHPAAPGSFSAVLTFNTQTMFLVAAAKASPVLAVDLNGAWRVLTTGEAVEFGPVEQGSSAVRRFELQNPTTAPLPVDVLAVEGLGFRGPADIELPFTLQPAATIPFEIRFEPATPGPHSGWLTVSSRKFPLLGAGLSPPPPKPQIRLETATLGSAQQARVTIRFAAPARISGSGLLRLEFIPNVAGASGNPALGFDPAIQFLSPAGPVAPFTWAEGSLTARFGDREEAVFQTGTTAGTITLTAQLGEESDQLSLPIPPAPVVIDSATAVRKASDIEIRLAGFDNTRSVSQVVFTLFDRTGLAIDPGPIRVDAAAEFRRHFESAGLGGVFAMQAKFPVAGGGDRIGAVQVEMTNSVGVTRTERIPVQ